MNLDEKNEIDFASDADEPVESPNEAKPDSEPTGRDVSCTDAESQEEEARDDGSGPQPQSAPSGAAGRLRADGSKLKSILEALIFVSEQPVSLDKMASVLTDCSRRELKEALGELEQEYEERGGALEIVEVAHGYQFRTRSEFAPWIGRLRQQRFARLSRAALETLAIVAYRQPVTRAEVESIRGVDTGPVLGTLLERRLLRILGRKEVPGRPILYGTTQEFLEIFGLRNLKDLPTLREIKDMIETSQRVSESPEGGEAEEVQTAGEEEIGVHAKPVAPETAPLGGGDSPVQGEREEELEVLSKPDLGGAWSEDGPVADDEITARELDEILKRTKTRLERYEADLQAEAEAQKGEPGKGTETGRAAQGEEPDHD